MKLKCLGQIIAPYVLKDCMSALLSVGCRVMRLGWHFVWLGRRRPALIPPSGSLLMVLSVDGCCPQLYDSIKKIDLQDPAVRAETGICVEDF